MACVYTDTKLMRGLILEKEALIGCCIQRCLLGVRHISWRGDQITELPQAQKLGDQQEGQR